MIDTLYYGEHCSCSGHSHFHNESPAISFNVVQAFLQRIHNKPELAEGIDPGLWSAVVKVINEATVEGLSQSNATSTHDEEFYRALRHSNEVFAAFKVHSLAGEVAKNLLDSDGKLKDFRQWVDDVKGITSHHVGAWLRTEYDTAVIRAHNAADWRKFERNKDILPNLRWMPTTSPSPEGSHRNYWMAKLTLPIDDPFWNNHHPGDRWNCKCSLEATDDPVNRPADMDAPLPQKGLENNPGKDGHIFNDTHPYFPDKCSQCSFYKPGIKGRIATVFLNREKDCYNCPYVDAAIPNGFYQDKEMRERLLISNTADKQDLNANIKVSRSLLSSFPNMKIRIRPHILEEDVSNPELEINGLIADNKMIRGEQGITSAFQKAIKQGCSIVVIDLDARLKRLNTFELSKYLNRRKADFEQGIIKETYVVYKGKAVKVIPYTQNRVEIENVLKQLEP